MQYLQYVTAFDRNISPFDSTSPPLTDRRGFMAGKTKDENGGRMAPFTFYPVPYYPGFRMEFDTDSCLNKL
jgi:hypothetical protein